MKKITSLIMMTFCLSGLASAKSYYGLTEKGKACGIKITENEVTILGEYDDISIMRGIILKDQISIQDIKKNFYYKIDLTNRELMKKNEIEETNRTILVKEIKSGQRLKEIIKYDHKVGTGVEKTVVELDSLEMPTRFSLQKDTIEYRMPDNLVGKKSFWFDLDRMREKITITRATNCLGMVQDEKITVSELTLDSYDQHSSDQ